MLFRVLADLAAAAHFAFIAYVVAGGFLAWHRPRTLGLHALAVAWGFGTLVVSVDCPLTTLENWARERGGQPVLPEGGFIQHYLTGVLYPESALGAVRLLAVLLVLGSWAGFAARRAGRHAHSPSRQVH